MLGLHPRRQPGPEILGQGSGLLGPGGPVGGHDHRANVPQVDLVDPGPGSFGPVAPFGRFQSGGHALGQGDEGVGLYGGQALGLGLLVHAADGLSDAGHAAPQNLFGQGVLIGGQGIQGGPAVNPLRFEPFGAGLGRPLGAVSFGPVAAARAVAVRGALPVATLAAVPVPAAIAVLPAIPVLAAVAVLPPVAVPAAVAVPSPVAVPAAVAVLPAVPVFAAITVLPAVAVLSAVPLAVARSAIPAGASLVPPILSRLIRAPLASPAVGPAVAFVSGGLGLKATAALFGGEPGRHQGADFSAQQLKSIRLGALRFGFEDGDYVEAVEMGVGLDPEDVAH